MLLTILRPLCSESFRKEAEGRVGRKWAGTWFLHPGKEKQNNKPEMQAGMVMNTHRGLSRVMPGVGAHVGPRGTFQCRVLSA